MTDGEENGRVVVQFDPERGGRGRRAIVCSQAFPDSLSVYAYPSPPGDVDNLDDVRAVPSALAGFLVLLALAAVGHAVATSVRRRRHEVGVVRSLGFTRGDVQAMITVQTAIMTVVGVVFGLPLGIVLGRVSWSLVADGLGVAVLPAVPLRPDPRLLAAVSRRHAWPSPRRARARGGARPRRRRPANGVTARTAHAVG